MKTLKNPSSVKYAVIQVRQSNREIERFAIAYHDEQVLRGFLTACSIVGTGFSSRDEAMKISAITTGITKRKSLLNLVHRLRIRNRCDYLRIFRVRPLSRLHAQAHALTAMNNAAHLAGAALHKMQFRLREALQEFAPAVH